MKQSLSLTKLPEWVTFPLMESIPFYKNILQRNPEELKYLQTFSSLVEITPGEVMIRKGDVDCYVYSVLLGQLIAFYDHTTRHPVGYISRGEMFGEMAMVQNLKRQATVVADSNSKKIMLLATDFSPFGEIEDFSEISLKTKLAFFHSAIDIIRKRLVAFRVNYPDYQIAKRALKSSRFEGKKGTLEELLHLYEATRLLSKQLNEWNAEVGNLFSAQPYVLPDTLETLTMLFDKHKKSA